MNYRTVWEEFELVLKQLDDRELNKKIIVGVSTYNQDVNAVVRRLEAVKSGGYAGYSLFSYNYLNRNINVPSSYDWCLCSRIKTDSISDDRVLLGLSTHALLTTDDSVAGYLNGDGSIKWYKYVNTVYTELLSPQVATADVYHTQEISKVSTSFEFIVDTGSLDTETIAEYQHTILLLFYAFNIDFTHPVHLHIHHMDNNGIPEISLVIQFALPKACFEAFDVPIPGLFFAVESLHRYCNHLNNL